MRPTPTRPQRPVSDYRVRTARRPKADYSWLDEDWDPVTDYPEDPFEEQRLEDQRFDEEMRALYQPHPDEHSECGMCGTPIDPMGNICHSCWVELKFGYLRYED